MARKFYKNTFVVTVLSEDEPYTFNDFETLDYDVSEGHFSGAVDEVVSTQLNGKECAEALANQGSAPEFFRLSENGEDLGED